MSCGQVCMCVRVYLCTYLCMCEGMEMKGAGHDGMGNCLGSGLGSNWALQPLVVVVFVYVHMYICEYNLIN
jgi:hypothetical protein